jgi:hypothetical protein
MRLLAVLLTAWFGLASAAHAQTVPAGSGTLGFKEKLATSCGSFADVGTMDVVLFANETWTADTPAGDFGGTLTPLDTKGRSWRLDFDGGSLAAYEAYLEDQATMICSSPVSISDLVVELVVKLGKGNTTATATLKAQATGVAAIFSGRGKHQIEAKGAFQPGALPMSFPWFEGTYFTPGPQ